jgi:beta-glucosidase
MGRALGRDCRARGVHILLAPGVNIYRSPLCSRNFEYAGEDPFLASRFAVGYITGVQDMGVSATVKHFACNFQEYERHHVSSDVDERTLEEVYLPAFEAAVKEAGVGAVMIAYNLVNGVQCSEHPGLLRDTLKGRWGFDGLVMSDWISTYSAVGAANAGLDLEMPEALWLDTEHLLPAIEQGLVSEAVIDDKVRRLLRLAVCFGWLDSDQLDRSIPEDDPETAAVALELSRAGCVLLRNEQDFLPLDRSRCGRLAVLGFGAHPADAVISGGGSAYTPPFRATSVLDGVRALCGPDLEISYAPGPDVSPDIDVYAASRFECPQGAGLFGEYFNNNQLQGEPVATRVDPQVNFFWGKERPAPEVSVRQYSVRWTGTIRTDKAGAHEFFSRCRNGHYTISVDGKSVIDTWERERNGMHRAEVHLEGGRHYAIKIEWRKTRVSGNMKFGWRAVTDVVPGLQECVSVASAADAAIVCVGFDRVAESEGYDRDFRMSDDVERMLVAVAEAQPNTVVVLTAGGNVDMSGWIDRVRGVLHAWYPGQAGGQAIAEILFGEVNPSGRLPATFEKRLEDRSSFDCYHDEDGDRRVALSDGLMGGYRHFDKTGTKPRFPFGFGLSYTRIRYNSITLSQSEIGAGGSIRVSVEIENTGPRRGAEVVQLYIADCQPRLLRPPKELKAFRKVWLDPGERHVVELSVDSSMLEFHDPELQRRVAEPGKFEVLVGPNAGTVKLSQPFVLT